MPRVTIIIPSWNRASWLPCAIDSVLNQTYPDYELVVVDDGSTDETPSLLDLYSKKLTVRTLPKNRGVSAARNEGIRTTDSEWVAFLDSDDRWVPRKLEKQMLKVQEQPDLHVHFTDEIWIRKGKRVNPMQKHQKKEGWIFKPSLSLCLMAPSSILIRRNVFEVCGLFDETLPVCEDYDLWLKITARYPVSLLNEKLMLRYGGHMDQLSQRDWGNDRYRIQSLQNVLCTVPLSDEDRQAAIKKLEEKCAILTQGCLKRGKTEEAKYYASIQANYI